MSCRTQGALNITGEETIVPHVRSGATTFPTKTAPDASPLHLTGHLLSSQEYYEAISGKSPTMVLGAAMKVKADEVSIHGRTFCWADAEQFLWGGKGDPLGGALPGFHLLPSREREKQICLLKVRVIHHLASHGWTPWGFGGRYDKLINVLSDPGAAQLRSLFEQENFEGFGNRVQDLIVRHEAETSRQGIPWASVIEGALGGKSSLESRFDVGGHYKMKQGRELRIVIRDRLYRGGWVQKIEAEGYCTVGSYKEEAAMLCPQ
jgi:hypothetical protein